MAKKIEWIWGLGRRKKAIARVRIAPGNGQMLINKKPLGQYFLNVKDQLAVLEPLSATEAKEKYDIFVNVEGGGCTGQAGAVKLGIARALCKAEAEFHAPLRSAKLLTRDPRMKERKKYGHKKARKSFQFSKR